MQRLFVLASVGVLALGLLLFLQWPLREWVPGSASRLANDFGQIVFAMYLAWAVAYATLRDQHVRARGRWHASVRVKAWAAALLVLPWALFILWSSAPAVAQSVWGLEHFAETLNPGYFLVRLALLLLALLVLVSVVQRAWQKAPHGD